MTPIQTAADILSTIPQIAGCCGPTYTQPINCAALAALREAVANASDEEEIQARILARTLPVLRNNVIRMQAQADGDAVANGGTPNATSEEWLRQARELLLAVEARLGVTND
jgi:hypothetical protein|tara:strand:+ start:24 stop:359 length:336 start_codon:yes stop_codon:yes gene_type:complete